MPSSLPNVKIANKFAGSSLANRIQAANDALGANPGEIWIYDGGTIDTDIILSPRRRLRFFNGDYNFINRKKIYFDDYTHFWGESHAAVLNESDVPRDASGGTVSDYFMLVNVKAQTAAAGGIGSSYSAAGVVRSAATFGINIEGLQFKGKRGNLTDATTALLGLWNVHSSTVQKCFFNGITGYTAQVGAESGNLTDARLVGKEYAHGFRFIDNEMQYCASQHVACHNGDSVYIARNTFKDPGKYPIKITSITGSPAVLTLAEAGDFRPLRDMIISGANRADGTVSTELNNRWIIGDQITPSSFYLKVSPSGAAVDISALGGYQGNSGFATSVGANATSVIDLESNTSAMNQQLVMITITDNTFDLRGANVPTNLISINTPSGTLCKGIVVANNTAYGAEHGQGSMADGISVAYLGEVPGGTAGEEVQIHNNFMKNMSGRGLYLSGRSINAHHNTIIDGARNTTSSIECFDLRNSIVADNTIENPNYYRSHLDLHDNCYNNKILRNNVGGKTNANGGSSIRHGNMQGGVFKANATGSIHHNIFEGNILEGADSYILETANSDNNTYSGNLSGLGVTKVGANSKIITDEFLDGSILITNLVVPVAAVSTAGLTNFARAAGASASASANYTNGADVTSAAYVIDGTRAANYPAIAHSTGAVPYTLDIDFGASRIIKVVNIFFYDGDNKSEPTVNTALTQFPFKKFNILYFDGTNFIPKSTEANNTKALKQFDWTAAPVTTTKIRFEVTDVSANGGNGFARIEEIEVFG